MVLIIVFEYVKNCLIFEFLFLKIECVVCCKIFLKFFIFKVKFCFILYIWNMFVMLWLCMVVVMVICVDEIVVLNLVYNYLYKIVKICVMLYGVFLFLIYLVVSYEFCNWGEIIFYRCYWLWNLYWLVREVIVIMLMSYVL